MSVMAFAGMVKDVNAARDLASQLKNERRHEYVTSQKRSGCVRERMFINETSHGPMMMIYREGVNAHMHLATVMNSSSAFDKFFVESAGKISGMDLKSMPAGPPPHLAFEWTQGQRSRNCTMFAAPVPDATKLWAFMREVSGRPAEHAESRQRHGIVFEQVSYLHDAKMAVIYMEGNDVQTAMGRIIQSTSSYDKWFIQQVSAVHGLDFTKVELKTPELLVLFDAE